MDLKRISEIRKELKEHEDKFIEEVGADRLKKLDINLVIIAARSDEGFHVYGNWKFVNCYEAIGVLDKIKRDMLLQDEKKSRAGQGFKFFS